MEVNYDNQGWGTVCDDQYVTQQCTNTLVNLVLTVGARAKDVVCMVVGYVFKVCYTVEPRL